MAASDVYKRQTSSRANTTAAGTPTSVPGAFSPSRKPLRHPRCRPSSRSPHTPRHPRRRWTTCPSDRVLTGGGPRCRKIRPPRGGDKTGPPDPCATSAPGAAGPPELRVVAVREPLDRRKNRGGAGPSRIRATQRSSRLHPETKKSRNAAAFRDFSYSRRAIWQAPRQVSRP